MKSKIKRILIVDDEPAAVAAIERAGIDLLCEVTTLEHTSAFERVVDEWRPDIVVLDVGIPDRDGYTLQSVLADHKYAGAVIMISGQPMQDLEAAARIGKMRGLNTIGVVRKPIAHDDIHAMLSKAKA
jgi:CheY-like chemotaxis protein